MEATVIRGGKLSNGFPSARRAYVPNPPAMNMAFGAVREGSCGEVEGYSRESQ